MFAFPATAAALIALLAWDTKHKGFIFALELGGCWAFAAYWLVKGQEIKKTKEDAEAAAMALQTSAKARPEARFLA